MIKSEEFVTAFNIMQDREGRNLRTNDPIDPGGDTLSGVSRENWPYWIGWNLLEQSGGKVTPEIVQAVEDFFYEQFWGRIQGDALADRSTDVATEVFDTSVNFGCTRGVQFLQEALSLLNLNKRLYPDLVLDGQVGWKTLETLRLYCVSRPPKREVSISRLLRVMNCLQGSHYIEQMRKYPAKEKYRGWFDRI